MPLPAPFKLVSAADSISNTDYRTLYTVPAGKQAVVKSVIAANATNASAQPSLQLVKPAGSALLAAPSLSAAAATNMLAGTLVMAAGESLRQKSDKNTILVGSDIGVPASEPRVINPSFYEITRLNGLLLAFGYSSGSDPFNSFIFTSVDGVTWNFRDTNPADASAGSALSAAYGAGVYVIVGDGGFISTSPDGVTWTKRTSALGSSSLTSIVFAAGKFVAVGTGAAAASIQTSADGITWTARTSPSALNSPQVAYDPSIGGGLFVVTTGAANGLHTSPDGITWTQRASAYTTYLVQSIGGRFVVKASGTHLVSTDGINWFVVSAALAGGGSGTSYLNSYKVVAGKLFFGNSNSLYYTSDGLSWAQVGLPNVTNPVLAFDGTNYYVANAGSSAIYKVPAVDKSASQTVSFTASIIEVAA